MKRKQTTIAKEQKLSGIGLHTGVKVEMTLRAAEADTGIVFHLTENGGTVDIPVNPQTTGAGMHRTIAKVGDAAIETVEHLLAAVAGMGIDNMHIDLTAPEPPGAGGSACGFFDLLSEAGKAELDADCKPFVLKNAVAVSDGKGGSVCAVPHAKGLKLTYVVHYPESKLAQGLAEFEISPETFAQEIAPCRTFCMEAHVEAMQAAGCGKGANTDNTLVLREDSVVDTELRFPDECARHKVLDLLGDVSVLGRPLGMHIVSVRGGHELNAELVKKLCAEIRRQEQPKGLMDVREIQKILPHRYPFFLVDRVLEMEEGKRIVGLKNVTRNEEFFNGHFPGQPVMPGVLQIEALAQTGGIMLLGGENKDKNLLAVLMSINDVKYRRPVVPGDQLEMEVVAERIKGRIGQVKATSRVDGEVATEARIKFALVESDSYTG